ncbi:hypothetical protein HMPREF0663_11674 [Hoylesella oralis ATCC 33269]|uniref:Uncharacterized protein n=1 Tax=Hoylesella oralis ATCC 33269 TaxID=873533 RepID=E7RR73_9BACT|nr:hypothetical protein HMPREF0663_11674 [Hoylesella oralis ATCC 33269]
MPLPWGINTAQSYEIFRNIAPRSTEFNGSGTLPMRFICHIYATCTVCLKGLNITPIRAVLRNLEK